MAHPPGSSSLVQQETTRHRALLVVFLVSAGVCLSFDQLGKWWAFASWREPAAIWQVIPGLYAGAQARNYGGIYSLDGYGTPFLRGGLTFLTVYSSIFLQNRGLRNHRGGVAPGAVSLPGADGSTC